ncbi:unnamed protein product [Ectocarpus sp. CCAP 1310/34]|nr:unnamed protein product [Ectocarpus sp. CCAP 1310/34]
MDELNESLGRNAKERMTDVTLDYFRRELKKPDIGLGSTVFPEPNESDKDVFNAQILFNKLAVKVFLSHNWKSFATISPDIIPPDFIEVIADAHVMHTIKYPIYKDQSERVHLVETTQEFIDLTWQLIVKVCLPRFETSVHVSPDDLSSASVRKWLSSAPFLQQLAAPGTNDIEYFLDPGSRTNQELFEVGKNLEARYPRMSIKMHTGKPEVREFDDGRRDLAMLATLGKDVSWATTWDIVSSILKANGIFIYAEIYHDSSTPFRFQYALKDGVELEYTPEDIEKINEFMSVVLEDVRSNKNLDSLVGLVRDATFSTTAVIYTVKDYTSRVEIDNIEFILGRESGNKVAMVLSPDLLIEKASRGHLHFVGDDSIDVSYLGDAPASVVETHENVQRETEDLANLGKVVDFKESPESVIQKNGVDLCHVVFGNSDNLFHRKNVTIAVFESLATTKGSGLFGRISDLFADLINHRERLASEKGQSALDTLLKQLDTLHGIRREYTVCSSEEGTCLATDTIHTTTLLANTALAHLHDLATPKLASSIDEVAGDNVDGWKAFEQARDSNDRNRNKMARAAVTCAALIVENGTYPDIFHAYHARKAQHGSSDRFPLGIGSFIWKFFMDVGDSIKSFADRKSYFENFSRVILKDHVEDVHGMRVADTIRFAHDVSLCMEVQGGRSIMGAVRGERFFYRHEHVVSWHLLMYAVICLICRIIFNFIPGHYNGTQKKSVANMLHLLVGISGLTMVLPLEAVHLVVWVGVTYATESFYGALLASSEFPKKVASWIMRPFSGKESNEYVPLPDDIRSARNAARTTGHPVENNWKSRPARRRNPISRLGST